MISDQFEADVIINMDETPFWFDLVYDRTVEVTGAKSVNVSHSGNDKKRFTVVASVTASGSFLPTAFIFKGKIAIDLLSINKLKSKHSEIGTFVSICQFV